MNIIGITSAFLSIRRDRSPEYYSMPLKHFTNRLVTDDPLMPVLVFTDKYLHHELPKSENILIEHCNPDDLLQQFWSERNWAEKYLGLKRLPGLDKIFAINSLKLLSVWLGKFAMIKKGFDLGFDVVFWFDSGHWTSHQHFADFSKYSEAMLSKVACKNLSSRLLSAAEKYEILSTQAWPTLKELHIPLEAYYTVGEEMGYNRPDGLPLYQGVFLLIHKKRFDHFFRRCQFWWERLVADGYGGTEESALTLFGWENHIERLTYLNWLAVLEGSSITDKMLDWNSWE